MQNALKDFVIPIIGFLGTFYGLYLIYGQLTLTKVQSLNQQNFKVHELFLQYPELRPYFYGDEGKGALTFEDIPDEAMRQRARSMAGYVLDFMDLVLYMKERHDRDYSLEPDHRVYDCYIAYIEGSLRASRMLRDYVDTYPGFFDALQPYWPKDIPHTTPGEPSTQPPARAVTTARDTSPDALHVR